MDNNIFDSADNEALHAALYNIHWFIHLDALGEIRKCLAILHKNEDNVDARKAIRQYIVEFETLREQLEASTDYAGRLRSHLIRTHGCSGECSSAGSPGRRKR